MNIQTVASLCPDSENERIKVKVIRLWTVRGPDPALPFSMELVLMDVDGTKIGAHVCKNHFPIFSHLIVEDETYVMHGFNVGPNYDYIRTTMNPNKIYFYDDTVVHHVLNTPIVRSPFSFVPIADLQLASSLPSYLVDVIGILTFVSAELSYIVRGNVVRMRSIELSSDGHKVTCHLAGRFADEFNAFMLAGAENIKVVIQFGKMKSYKGELCICTNIGESRIFFNPEIVEADHIWP